MGGGGSIEAVFVEHLRVFPKKVVSSCRGTFLRRGEIPPRPLSLQRCGQITSEVARSPRPPCVTCRLVAVSLRGPRQSPVLPFACCVGSMLSDNRCGRRSL